MPSNVTLKQMLEVGVHFGHRTQKWNPKMKPYIFMQRNGIHIIDLQQTHANLNTYYDMVVSMVAKGGTVLFVGTKRQAQEAVAQAADKCGMPYVNERWLGGTLTNWRTIKERINTLKRLEKRRDDGEFRLLTKREALMLTREIEKLQLRLGGIREMKDVPQLMVVVDTKREVTAVKEANTLSIPVMALVDTNADPDVIDYILPANDDAMRSIQLILNAIADAVNEGKAAAIGGGDDDDQDFAEMIGAAPSGPAFDDDADDESYLGERTLENLRRLELDADDDDE